MFAFFLIGCALLLFREIPNILWWRSFGILFVVTLLAYFVL